VRSACGHAFGYVDPGPLLAGIRFVPPWSSIERYSTREEQWPTRGEQVEAIEALSSEQMGMHVEVSIRWQIDPMQAPKIFTEIGDESQIRGAVLKRHSQRGARRHGAVFHQRHLQALADREHHGGPGGLRPGNATPRRWWELSHRHGHGVLPPRPATAAQVVQAINNKIAQEQQIETERHRVEVARLQTEQQRLLNQTLSPEALTKQWIEVLHDMRGSSNLIIFVPTEGGLPLLNISELRKNLKP